MKLNSFKKIPKSPVLRGFFFVFLALLAACNTPEATIKSFTYTSPMALINAMKNVAGFEDSHLIPGHEKLVHEHSTPESWTTKAAIEELGQEVMRYKELNSGFKMIVGNCNIPDHKYHSHSVEGKMVHYSNSVVFQGKMVDADQAFTKFGNEVYWVLVFTDRILLIKLEGDGELKVKEKRLSP